MTRISEIRPQIESYFQEEYDLSLVHPEVTVYVIGSFATGAVTSESDVDILFTELPSDITISGGQKIPRCISYNGVERPLHINVNLVEGLTNSTYIRL